MGHYSERLLSYIRTADQVVTQTKEQKMRDYGITTAQHAALAVLSDHDGVTSAELARLCGVTPQTMNSTVGRLEARGYDAGRMVARARQETSGAPARLRLTPDRDSIAADGRDLAVVRIDVLDASGRPAPHADTPLHFGVQGPGRLIGVGNGDPTSHEPDKASTRRAFSGSAMAIVQSDGRPGVIRVRAGCDFGSFEARIAAA